MRWVWGERSPPGLGFLAWEVQLSRCVAGDLATGTSSRAPEVGGGGWGLEPGTRKQVAVGTSGLNR